MPIDAFEKGDACSILSDASDSLTLTSTNNVSPKVCKAIQLSTPSNIPEQRPFKYHREVNRREWFFIWHACVDLRHFHAFCGMSKLVHEGLKGGYRHDVTDSVAKKSASPRLAKMLDGARE
jgi:hypothetical protein